VVDGPVDAGFQDDRRFSQRPGDPLCLPATRRAVSKPEPLRPGDGGDRRKPVQAVNSRDRSFSRGSIERRRAQVEASIERYLSALETADRQEGELAEAKSARLKDKIGALRE
jgi:hypothetical protein